MCTTLAAPTLPKKAYIRQPDPRQAWCTHIKMTRLYDKSGATPCPVCHEHPAMGWLYRCTQDTDGSLPQSDFLEERQVNSPSPAESYRSLSDLKAASPPQCKSESDHQKESDDTRPTTRASSNQESIMISIPESNTFSTLATSTNNDDELQEAGCGADSSPVLSFPDDDQHQHRHATSGCTFRICSSCQPIYSDRAIESIDNVLNNPKTPPQWELDNRRVSDVRVLRTIGLHNGCD